MNKIIGVVFIIIGVCLIAWGYNVYDSVGSQITRTIKGEMPIEVWVGVVGGIINLVFGIYKITKK